MFTSLRLSNVRGFLGPGWNFDLRPLTLLCGANSSGKSTVLKSLMLLRQSNGIGESGAVRPGRLKFTGKQVDLGGYDSLISSGHSRNELSIGVTVNETMDHAMLKAILRANGTPYVESDLAGPRVPYKMSADYTFRKDFSDQLNPADDLSSEELTSSAFMSQSRVFR